MLSKPLAKGVFALRHVPGPQPSQLQKPSVDLGVRVWVWGSTLQGIKPEGRTWVGQPRPHISIARVPRPAVTRSEPGGPCVSCLPPATNLPVFGAPQTRGGRGEGSQDRDRVRPALHLPKGAEMVQEVRPRGGASFVLGLGGPGPARLGGEARGAGAGPRLTCSPLGS